MGHDVLQMPRKGETPREQSEGGIIAFSLVDKLPSIESIVDESGNAHWPVGAI
jgi:hypothetical protein